MPSYFKINGRLKRLKNQKPNAAVATGIPNATAALGAEFPRDSINLYLSVLLPRAVEVNAAIKASLQHRPAASLGLHVAVSLHTQREFSF